nr:MAG: RNA-dependent RNA polymerase [Moss associated botourmia-like virus 27]
MRDHTYNRSGRLHFYYDTTPTLNPSTVVESTETYPRASTPADNGGVRLSRRRSKDNKHKKRTPMGSPASILGSEVPVPSSTVVCAVHTGKGIQARNIVNFLRKELDFKPIRKVPDEVVCGTLRQVVRNCFSESLPVLAELSIKTAAKLENSWCDECGIRAAGELADWKKERFRSFSVDPHEVEEFKKACKLNVARGWNKRVYPYVPSGHATRTHKRREHGSWNVEEFSEFCRPEMVISGGKPRVVTLYSSENTRILTPLHHALYDEFRRYGWLLVGSPTDELVSGLNGDGDYVSVDYSAATDNIRAEYVNAMIDALIEQSEELGEDAIRCLRVLGELRLDEDRRDLVATCGQPMGSVMSFPLLCLINKTVFDMSLTSLLKEGRVSFKEWTSHRCLINGDDLIFKEPRAGPCLLKDRISKFGARTGLKLNAEKTMVSATEGEINSTLFVNGVRQKKTNVGALYMRPDVVDVLGFASESTVTDEGFLKCVRANAHILSKQEDKGVASLPVNRRILCRRDAKIRRAITSAPVQRRKQPTNYFPVCRRPEGYDLSRDEEVEVVRARVERVRPWVLNSTRAPRQRITIKRDAHTYSAATKEKPKRDQDDILGCLARFWELKESKAAAEKEGVSYFLQSEPSWYPPGYLGGQSMALAIVDSIRAWRQVKTLARPKQAGGAGTAPSSFGHSENIVQVV